MSMSNFKSCKLSELLREIEKENYSAIEEFWLDIERIGTPLVEEIDNSNVLVTFLYRDTENIENILIYGGVPGFRYSENIMEHIEGTDIWFRTYKVRNDVKFKYNFSLNYKFDNNYKNIKKNSIVDPLNPNIFQFAEDEENPEDKQQKFSLVKLPKVEEEFWTVSRESVKSGKIKSNRFYSEILGDTRRIWVYTPWNYRNDGSPYNLLVLTDGFEYMNMGAETVFNNLINDERISPMVCVFVESKENRYEELTCNEKLSDFLSEELITWIYENYNISKNPKERIIGGVSLGGLTATHIAYKNPHIFGNVLSQSGSYWYENQWLTKEYENNDRLPIKFYLNAGLLENHPYDDEPIMMEVINNMRDVLLNKGYSVAYENFPSGHDYLGWGETLATGLIALIGM
ncbi:alpha/beta hydrolase-fold protein [Clostridium sp. UBA6640]|uniref:alpha/beta hydrolase-fold protein n=1 Tax=Clostridium sp. UBA6640 TaxID=1946370 RepID=UPI0025BBF008|nr:alpha/beta hydrolase-fold protein [Clostridium sp. UBA6640]